MGSYIDRHADGDGVYEGSLTVDAGTYEYVHALTGSGDGWSGWGVIGNFSNCLSSTRNRKLWIYS